MLSTTPVRLFGATPTLLQTRTWILNKKGFRADSVTMAFCFLMEPGAGAAITARVQPTSEAAALVSLDPAVVAALATVAVRGSVLLSESDFLELIEEKAACPRHAHTR